MTYIHCLDFLINKFRLSFFLQHFIVELSELRKVKNRTLLLRVHVSTSTCPLSSNFLQTDNEVSNAYHSHKLDGEYLFLRYHLNRKSDSHLTTFICFSFAQHLIPFPNFLLSYVTWSNNISHQSYKRPIRTIQSVKRRVVVRCLGQLYHK